MLVGMRSGVRVICDAGAAYVDDGQRLFRMPFSTYAALLDLCASSDAAGLVDRYPLIFVPVETADAAARSIEAAHETADAGLSEPA